MATCPACHIRSHDDPEAFTVTPLLRAKPLGDYSIAGSTPKVVAVERWRLACRCGWSIEGWLEGDDFFGDPCTQIWPHGQPPDG